MNRPPRNSHFMHLAARAACWLCGRCRQQKNAQPPSVYEEMNRGSIIGLPACALSAIGSGSAIVMLWAGMFGLFVGALIGLLLWMGSDATPEDPVVPPAPGQARSPQPSRWT